MASTAASVASRVRVRYAPSPTGWLHLGGLRTALYNALYARKYGGTFLLRLEDTDRRRLVPGAAEGLLSALSWCGLTPDEGPHAPNPAYAPYVQSQRLERYARVAADMVACGHAYRCFCTPDRLAASRAAREAAGLPAVYDRACTRIPPAEAERRAAAGEPHVVRMFVPAGESFIHDEVLGDVRFGHEVVDDQVLLKSDGYPTYHLAAVVDDHVMDISHVIRGQEWLSSTPKHVLLYKAMGWTPPAFAHLPLLLNPDRTKLSKRHGDAAVEDFMTAGYMPEALINFVALLGWHPGGDVNEVMTMEDMVAQLVQFSLEGVNKANAIVDRSRLDFFNGEHVRRLLAGSTSGARRICAGVRPLIDHKRAALRNAADSASAHAPAPAASACASAAAAAAAASVDHLFERGSAVAARSSAAGSVAASGTHAIHAAALVQGVEGGSDGAGGEGAALSAEDERLAAVLRVQADRVRVLTDFVDLTLPFMASPTEFAAWMAQQVRADVVLRIHAASMAPKKGGKKAAAAAAAAPDAAPAPAPSLPGAAALFDSLRPVFALIADEWQRVDEAAWASGAAFSAMQAVVKAHGKAAGAVMLPVRFALTGHDVGASMSDTLKLLGKDACVARLTHLAWMDALHAHAAQAAQAAHAPASADA